MEFAPTTTKHTTPADGADHIRVEGNVSSGKKGVVGEVRQQLTTRALQYLRPLPLLNTASLAYPGHRKILLDASSLNLSGTQIFSELPGLEKLSQLQSLNLGGTQIRELPGLERLGQLQYLNLSGTQVSRLPPIRWIAKIRVLLLEDTPFWKRLSEEDRKQLKLGAAR
jgi:Leucine-rich repeat (LRR) protein